VSGVTMRSSNASHSTMLRSVKLNLRVHIPTRDFTEGTTSHCTCRPTMMSSTTCVKARSSKTEHFCMISGHMHVGCWVYQCQETQPSGVTTSHRTNAGRFTCPQFHIAQHTVSPNECLAWRCSLGLLIVKPVIQIKPKTAVLQSPVLCWYNVFGLSTTIAALLS